MVRLNRTYFFAFKKLQAKFSKSSTSQIPANSQIPRNSPTQSANYAKFAHFVNLFYIMFQAPAPAENPAEFQRITQIPHDSPTQPANHANSAHFANFSCDREPRKIGAQDSAQFAHLLNYEFRAFHSKLIHVS